MKIPVAVACVFTLALSLSGLAEAQDPVAAEAVINPTQDQSASGLIEFSRDGSAVRVRGLVSGLEPDSVHGFHIHEKGDCSGPGAESAGEHFNPAGMPHAGPQSVLRHMGDLGNIQASPEGVATVDIQVQGVDLEGPNSIIGRSILVHAQPDDLSSQPSGQSGPRIACGVIEKVE